MTQKLLFICGKNKLRSPTAEAVFGGMEGKEVRSAGLSNDADVLLGTEDVEWADIIFVMEQAHKKKLKERYRAHLNGQKVVCLGIPDKYKYMDPALVSILESRVATYLD